MKSEATGASDSRFAELVVAPPGPDELPAGAASGVFLHAILETAPPALAGEPLADWLARPAVEAAIARQARRFSVEGPPRRHAERMVHAAWTTPLRALGPLGAARAILRELQFLLPRSGGDMVRGFIDLVAELDGRIVLVDWKSDLLGAWDAPSLAAVVGAHYRLQARLYTLALVQHLKITDEHGWQRFGGIAYCFLRGLPFLAPSGEGKGREDLPFLTPSGEGKNREDLPPVSHGGHCSNAGWHLERPEWSEVLAWHEELLGGAQ
jgi:exodeoxyribonuclease V beta subunit